MTEAEKTKEKEEIKKLAAQKEQLHAEIGIYGKDLESIQTEIANSKKIKLNIEELTEELKALEIKKTDYETIFAEAKEIEKKKSSLLAEIEKHKKVVEEIQALVQKLADLKKNLADLEKEITQANSHKEAAEKDLKAVETTLQESNNKIAAMESFYTGREFELKASISAKEIETAEQISTLQESVDSKEKELTEANKNVDEKNIEYKALVKSISDLQISFNTLDETYKEKVAEKEKELTEITKKADEKLQALDQRDGDLSIKESTYESKRLGLIAVKTRLEKESGKSIIINI